MRPWQSLWENATPEPGTTCFKWAAIYEVTTGPDICKIYNAPYNIPKQMALVSCDWQITRMVVVFFTAGLPGANQDKVQETEIRNLEISLSATCSSAAAGRGEQDAPKPPEQQPGLSHSSCSCLAPSPQHPPMHGKLALHAQTNKRAFFSISQTT